MQTKMQDFKIVYKKHSGRYYANEYQEIFKAFGDCLISSDAIFLGTKKINDPFIATISYPGNTKKNQIIINPVYAN
jgi:hypothetical protein